MHSDMKHLRISKKKLQVMQGKIAVFARLLLEKTPEFASSTSF